MRSFALLNILRLALVVAIYSAACGRASAEENVDSLREKAKATLPQLHGEISVPGLKEPVEVLRDRWGVPHIYARNQDDLFFAQGFVVAQDRLFQMDLWRRVAAGETAEWLGRRALEADRFARLIQYRGDMEAEWASYAPDAQQIAAAFSRGVNACIDHLGDRLPVEYQLLGARPKKWRPEDCLGRMSGIVMTRNLQSEVARAELVAAVGVEKARRLAPTDPPRDYAPAPGLDLAGIDREILAAFTAATRPLTFEAARGGSNNWVVDGTRSASGKPLLANDPHRSLTLPSLRYLVHLHAPGWHVIGAGEPGLPGVALGHNERVAWGFTIVGTDQCDLYVEETDPADPARYKVGDGWESMRVVREQVVVRDEPRPAEVELRFTRHGPVLHHDAKRHRAYALKWAGSEPGTAAYLGALALSRAGNWRAFLAAVRAWKLPSENLVYADVDGNIGWVAAALTPVRDGWDGLLPVPGAGGRYEWRAFRPVEELPQAFNPPDHYLLTANHNILPPGYARPISHEWALPYRAARLKQRLEEQRKFDVADFQSMQLDNTSLPGLVLARLAGRLRFEDESLRAWAELLAGWDGVLARDSRAGPLYAAWLQELSAEFFRPHVPERLLGFVRGGRGLEVMLAALQSPGTDWFGADPAAGRDRLLHSTFEAAARKVRAALPGDPAAWQWGRLHTATFRHPLTGLSPFVENAFNLGPLGRPGDGVTPNAATHDERFRQVSGASYRQIFDLADWDCGVATSVPGQSGQPGSPHYADLLPLWERGEYFPLAFSRTRVEQVSRHRLLLRPASR